MCFDLPKRMKTLTLLKCLRCRNSKVWTLRLFPYPTFMTLKTFTHRKKLNVLVVGYVTKPFDPSGP